MEQPPGEERNLFTAAEPELASEALDEAGQAQAEEGLRKSEARYRSLLESIRDAVYVIGTDGRFAFVNEVMVRRSGHPKEWFIDRHYLDVLRPEYREKARAAFESNMRGETAPPYEVVPVYKGPDGEDLWVEIIRTPIYENGIVAGVLGVSRDITERKRAEKALRYSEWRYRSLLQSIEDGVGLVGRDWKFGYVNDVIARRAGHPPEWFRERTPLDIVKPEHKDHLRACIEAGFEGKSVPSFEISYLNAAGRELWLECRITALYQGEEVRELMAVNRDITHRKHMEEELRGHRDHLEQLVAERTAAFMSSEKKYRELVDNALVGVYQTRLNGEILYANPTLLAMHGYASKEEIGSAVSLYVNPGDRRELVRMIKASGTVRAHELRLLTGSGKVINVLLSATLTGDVISGMIMDITDRKKTEAELEKKSGRLQDTNTALRVLLDQREEDRREMEGRFRASLESLVVPYIERLMGSPLTSGQRAIAESMEANVRAIQSPLTRDLHDYYSRFTPTEAVVADLIKEGKSTKEIAVKLAVSENAVNLHRQHIRDKLGLKNTKRNLTTYLTSTSD